LIKYFLLIGGFVISESLVFTEICVTVQHHPAQNNKPCAHARRETAYG